MKIYATLDMTMIDATAAPKGEEFDDEIQSLLDGIEVDGYEMNDVSISREKPDKSPLGSVLDSMYFEQAKSLIALVDEGKGAEPSAVNATYTNVEMLGWHAKILIEQLEKTVQIPKPKKLKMRRRA